MLVCCRECLAALKYRRRRGARRQALGKHGSRSLMKLANSYPDVATLMYVHLDQYPRDPSPYSCHFTGNVLVAYSLRLHGGYTRHLRFAKNR